MTGDGPRAMAEHCATCGHLLAMHNREGCLAQVRRGIAGGRRVGPCRCGGFVWPIPDMGIFQINKEAG